VRIFTEKYKAGANTHKLSVAVFASILAATLSFLGAFHYFNNVYRSIFSEISTYTNTAIVNSELNRRFMDLELDVRNLLTIVLRAPEQVADFHRNLRDDFAALQKLVNESEEIRIKEQVHEELDTYQNFLDRLLQDYSMLNVELQSINTFFKTYKLALEQLQEKIGNAIVETTLAEQNVEGLLQAFVLVPLCDEEFLNSHSQLRSSIANYTPSLLGVVIDDAHQKDFSKTTLGHLATMEKTLRTMTSADAPIGPTIKNMVKILPEYRDNIKRLHDILVSSMAHYEEFIIARDVILISLEDVDQIGSDGIKNIQMLAKRHEKQEYYLSFLISALIMTVALAGFLLTRRAAKQLNTVVKDIVEAKEQQQEMNVQLKQEIAERLKAEKLLSLARDDLEIRVEQRTTELFNSNLLLQDEIKERLKTQKDLEAERERLLVTLKSIGDAVIATDTRGNILLLNQMAEKLTGWNQVDAVGKPLQEVFHVIHGQSHQSVKNPVEHVLAAGSVIGLADQVILVDRKGRGKNIADSCAPIRDSNGEIIGVVLVFRDITEHLKIEAELLKIKKLESIGVLAGGIAHDFNNILAAILGNINLASFDNELKESTRTLLSEAEKASLRAKDLTQQLLTFAKGGEPVKEISSLERVIIDSASFVLRGDKVACRYEIPEDLWMVNIDKKGVEK
jgi:PAS domain S-box-containing protein